MLAKTFKQLRAVNILVVGDFVLDHYTIGKIQRISPEAPVPVMHIQEESSRPGGAGNVALNLKALGAHVSVLGLVGDDKQGELLKSALDEQGIDTRFFSLSPTHSTIVKNRLIADSQHVLRLDAETVVELSQSEEDRVIAAIDGALEGIEVVALSDYAKGFLTRPILKALIAKAKERSIPVLVDPKGVDFTKYHGATLVKPNLKEAYIASQLPHSAPLDEAGAVLRRDAACEHLIITRSEKGISWFDPECERHDFPVRAQEVVDVTGAGDTVLAVLAFSIANSLSLSDAIELANLASSTAIERLGCAHITLADIAARLLEQHSENKVFEENHLFPLMEVLQNQEYMVVAVDDAAELSLSMLEHIHTVRGEHSGCKCILYLEEDRANSQLVSLLSSFQEVDFVVLKREGLAHLCKELHPKSVFYLSNEGIEKLAKIEHIFDRLRAVL